jgi:hypothetical protein
LLHDFLNQNQVQAIFHRKPVTMGCHEAIKERRKALGIELYEEHEIKTLALIGNTEKGEIKIAIHLRHGKMVKSKDEQIDGDYISRLLEMSGETKVNNIHSDPNAQNGRINFLSIFLNSPKTIHIVDVKLTEGLLEGTTNAGLNTYGVFYHDFSQL